MTEDLEATRAGRVFLWITAWPKTILVASLLVAGAVGSFLPQLEIDTKIDSYVPGDHPALRLRERTREIFGLDDPMVIAIVNEGPNGVFNPGTLSLVAWLTEQIATVPGVDPDRITSLATEKDIEGTEENLLVEHFFETPPAAQAEADRIREAVMDVPLYLGSLVARDGRATVVVAELLDPDGGGERLYRDLVTLAEKAPKTQGDVIHVAGQGAVDSYLHYYAQRDGRRLNPVSFLVIALVLFFSYRTVRAVLVPNLVVIMTLLTTVGAMAITGTPYYSTTSTLTVMLIAIGVADGIHILGQYYEEVMQRPQAGQREILLRTMTRMWRPVTITSITSTAGFASVAFTAIMPPLRSLGEFVAFGVFIALVLSLVTLPAALMLVRPRPSPAYRRRSGDAVAGQVDVFGRATGAVGMWLVRNPGLSVAFVVVFVAVAGVGISRVRINDDLLTTFHPREPIFQANHAINEYMDGSLYLDVMVETAEKEDLFKPENLRRIEALQAFLETLPHVNGTTSIADYVKQMNRAMNADRPEAYRIPDRSDLIAQYFLLYAASGDPTDFQEEVDYDYRLANVRATIGDTTWNSSRGVYEPAAAYIRDTFNAPGIQARLSGRASLDYHRARMVDRGHPRGVALAFLMVLAMTALSFRSFYAGLLSVFPVALSVLCVYAVMGFGRINLGTGTSIAIAAAIGVAVDFAVHTIDRMLVLMRQDGLGLERAFETLFPSTGRAILFNFAAVALGFGVLMLSISPRITEFGLLIFTCITASFIASMTVLPALVRLLRPAFLCGDARDDVASPVGEPSTGAAGQR